MIDSGLDSAGVDASLALLKSMSRENRKNIFLISHRDELAGRVTNILKVTKENGFTTYENDTELV
jgi:chromosome segregation ATPase